MSFSLIKELYFKEGTLLMLIWLQIVAVVALVAYASAGYLDGYQGTYTQGYASVPAYTAGYNGHQQVDYYVSIPLFQ